MKLILIAINNNFEAEEVTETKGEAFGCLQILKHDTLSKNHAQSDPLRGPVGNRNF